MDNRQKIEYKRCNCPYYIRSAYLIPYGADAKNYKFLTIIVRHSYPLPLYVMVRCCGKFINLSYCVSTREL